jgi:purine-binding chemotaxis protein CheW
MRTPAGDIDWAEVRRKLAKTVTAGDQPGSCSPEDAHRVLEARAKELARLPVTEPEGELELVVFTLASGRYAIAASLVHELLSHREVTLIPGSPGPVRGLVNRRGSIVTVIDLRLLFGIGSAEQLSDILVLGWEGAEVGLLVKEVVGLRRMSRGEIRPAAAIADALGSDYIRGVTADAVVVLDGEALILDERKAPSVEARDRLKE